MGLFWTYILILSYFQKKCLKFTEKQAVIEINWFRDKVFPLNKQGVADILDRKNMC